MKFESLVLIIICNHWHPLNCFISKVCLASNYPKRFSNSIRYIQRLLNDEITLDLNHLDTKRTIINECNYSVSSLRADKSLALAAVIWSIEFLARIL